MSPDERAARSLLGRAPLDDADRDREVLLRGTFRAVA